MRVRCCTAVCTGLAVFSAASVASATYSIAATDLSTHEVGGAVTSCVGSLDVGVVYGSIPGLGVIHAQAQLDSRSRGKNRALALIREGVSPNEIIAEITAVSFDAGSASRQYGIVDVQGRAAGFTGMQAQAYKADRQTRSANFAYAVHGNILTSQRVLDQAARGFEAGGCDLADRLLAALEAGAANGEGDSRCTERGIPSDSAFLEVDRPDEPLGNYLKISVTASGAENPLSKLRILFDTWRKSHPCASSPAVDAGQQHDDAGDAAATPAGSRPGPSAGATASEPMSGSSGMPVVAVPSAGQRAAQTTAGVGEMPAAISGKGGAAPLAGSAAAARRGGGCGISRGGEPSAALALLGSSLALGAIRRPRSRGSANAARGG